MRNEEDADESSIGYRIATAFAMSRWKPLSAGALISLVAAQATALPDAQELMRRSVEVTKANWAEAPNYSFIRRDVNSKRGSEPTKKAYKVLMIDGSPYLKIIAENGQGLSSQRESEENQKLAKEIAKRSGESPRERQSRIEKYARERNRDHALLSELAGAFDYTLRGESEKDGRKVWILAGKPKAGYVPPSREAKVLSGMDITFWIDKKTCQWLRVEAEIQKPVSIYGLIAKVGPGTKFMLEQEPISGDLWLPKRFTMQVKASALGFINEEFVHDEAYTDYKHAEVTVADASSRAIP